MAIPIVITKAGLTPQVPAEIRAKLIANVLAVRPGYTANLPGSLIEDIASTDVAAILLADGALVDAVNSVTPYGANAFVLAALGNQYGIGVGEASNTSVFVQFTGTPGYVIGKGFVVSDGTFQYAVQDGGVVGADRGDGLGQSDLLFAVATTAGIWAVPSGTVISTITSVPNPFVLTVTNPLPGIPAEESETEESYRARVLEAGLASASGMTTMLKTLLGNVPGVQTRLITVLQKSAGWEIIVGGGDPYLVAYAITKSGVDITKLVPSQITVIGVTKASPGVYTTDLDHGLVTGQVATVGSANPAQYNHTGAVTVIDEKNFSFDGFDTSAFANYIAGGVVTPNPRNIEVSIIDFPDTYTVPFVLPPQQDVAVTATWNTTLPNFVSQAAVAQQAAPAIAAYINSIVVGQPINTSEMTDAFKESVSNIIDPQFITRLIFSVSINGQPVAPVGGTYIIEGDPESFFFTNSSSVTVLQG
jgi:hypothetical protein